MGCGVHGGGMVNLSVRANEIHIGWWSDMVLVISLLTVPVWCRYMLGGRGVLSA